MTYTDFISGEMNKNGKTSDQIAKEFTDALNSITRAAKDNESKKKYIESMRSNLLAKLADNRPLTVVDIGRVAVLTYEQRHPEWSKEDVMRFSNAVKNSVEMTEQLFGKTEEDLLDDLANELTNLFFGNTTREESKADTDIIKKFLNDI